MVAAQTATQGSLVAAAGWAILARFSARCTDFQTLAIQHALDPWKSAATFLGLPVFRFPCSRSRHSRPRLPYQLKRTNSVAPAENHERRLFVPPKLYDLQLLSSSCCRRLHSGACCRATVRPTCEPFLAALRVTTLPLHFSTRDKLLTSPFAPSWHHRHHCTTSKTTVHLAIAAAQSAVHLRTTALERIATLAPASIYSGSFTLSLPSLVGYPRSCICILELV